MIQHPLIALIFSVILTLLVIKQCLSKKRLLRVKLSIAFLLNFTTTFLLVFYGEIKKNETGLEILNWSLLGIDIFIGLLFIFYSVITTTNEQFTQDLLETLQMSKLYVLVDKKNRVKEISPLFLEELDLTLEEAYKENFFNLIETKYEITKLNDAPTSANDLNIFYKDSNNTDGEMNLEVEDKDGKTAAFYFTETPIKVLNRFKGRIFIGGKITAENLVGMEKNLAQSSEELDIISSRFGVILEKTSEGIYFANHNDDTIWLSNSIAKSLYINGNELSYTSYIEHIHPDDKASYEMKLSQLNNLKPDYSVTYRFNIGNKYAIVKEEGSRITSGRTVEYCGIIRRLDGHNFELTQSELDKVFGETELTAHLESIYKNNQTVQFILLKVSNIPDINEEHGRMIGNVALSQYIKFFKDRYIDSNLIYRLSGLEFFAIITDYRKMDLLKKDLDNNERILHVPANYGAIKLQMEANVGICNSTDCRVSKEVLPRTKEALRFANNPQFKANYAYYRDIK